MSKLKLIDSILLEEYVILIKRIELVRSISISRYVELDRQRVTMHDMILEMAGTDRNDVDFTYELAVYCESLLSVG